MNYIEFLTKEEKTTLCEIITGKEFKEFFKKNEQAFSKIQKGFRAKSLTEQHALSIAINHIDNSFIASWVNIRVECWLKEIEENVVKLKKKGLSHESALAETMLDSFFSNNIELYFKLTGKSLDTEVCFNLCRRMENIKHERVKDSETADRIKAMEEENRRLFDQVETAQHRIDDIKNECADKVQKIEKEKKRLESLLDEAQVKISELQTAPNAFENDDADYLTQFDDTDLSILPSVHTDEIVSLCGVVSSDYSGQKRLMRYADLNSNGYYNVFHRNEDIPLSFTNRNIIFYKDGPSENGFYGVWTWSAVPNEKDPSKDYILSRYNADIKPIEIVVNTSVSDLDELVNLLKKGGIDHQPCSQRTMFSLCQSKGQYIGILCTDKELNMLNGKITVSEDCVAVPVYEFTNADIVHQENGPSFYRNAFAGLPSKIYRLKNPLDIVKDIVLSSVSWTAYKAREITRTQYTTFRDFIKDIPAEDITRKIGIKCHCSIPAAKGLLNEFLNTVWKYIDGDSLEDEIVLSAISTSVDLQEKTKELIRQDWERENERFLIETRQKIDRLRGELKATAENLKKAQEALNQTKAEDEHLSSVIAEKEKMAVDVENKVEEKIKKARENVADFIANMAFISGQQVQMVNAVTLPATNITSEYNTTTYCVHPEFEKSDELEVHHSWGDVINTAMYELTEAGVAKQYRGGLAAFLCAAYIERQPLVLVGPNAIDIAQAFCASVTAHKYGILYCEGGNIHRVIEKIGADDEKIVIINNFLVGGGLNKLPEIFSQKDIFYIATHPYAEDIQVEPKSLYGFVLPLFTEFLVDKKATGKYFGGYFSDDFKTYSTEKGARKELTVLSKFALSSLVRSKINSMMMTMHDIYHTATADVDFLFYIFPIAYASMEINKLVEVIADPQQGITISASLKRDLQHVLGEN